jgi:predicted aspartyl protease
MLFLASAAAGQEAPPVTHYDANSAAPVTSEPAVTTNLPMTSDSHERMTVPVRLGASRSYRFLVDTGTDRTLVSSELAHDLRLSERPAGTIHSATGSALVHMAWLPELSVNERSVRDIKAPMLAASDIGADGILGIDSLRSQRVVFDFTANRLAIVSGNAPLEFSPGAIVVRAKRKEGRLIVTDADMEGTRVNVVLDTGSGLTVGNEALRRKLASSGQLTPVGPIDLISVTGGRLRGELAVVRRLDMGGTRLEGLQVVFADAHTFHVLNLDRKPALLFGMNGMKWFDQVAIDFAGRTVSFVVPKDRRPVRS